MKILGYDRSGNEIHPAKSGRIYTAAFIICSKCRASIRSSGGPSSGALCIKCYNDKVESENNGQQ